MTGLVGVTNHVTREGDWVVRWPRDLADDGARFAKDVWCTARARGLGLGVPEGVELVPRPAGTGEGWACRHRFVPGEQLDESLGNWHLLGELAARIAPISPEHDAPDVMFTRFGRDIAHAWRAHLAYNIDTLGPTDRLLTSPSSPAYPAELRAEVCAVLLWLASQPVQLGLAHGDLRPANVIAAETGPVVIDWECAEFGPVPGRDLVGVIDHELDGRSPAGATDAFLAGWAAAGGWPVGPRVIAAHELLARLDLVRWALDRCPERLDELAARCAARVPALLRAFANAETRPS